jgi:hypothetical protein
MIRALIFFFSVVVGMGGGKKKRRRRRMVEKGRGRASCTTRVLAVTKLKLINMLVEDR